MISKQVAAREKWKELLSDNSSVFVEELAKRLTDAEMWFFKHSCGGRWLGQEIMAWSAFGFLYNTQVGFGENKRATEKLS